VTFLARKKVVLVIVEGPSDDTALGILLSQIYDKDSVYIHIMHGDITTKKGVCSQNIVSKIGKEIQNYAKSQHYKPSDFRQIIHIVDLDGTYIPNDCIFKEPDAKTVRYESDGIYTANPEHLIVRNKEKSENLYRLRSCSQIWGIPYRVYYMSCNLDHVLYDQRNSTDEAKENNAYAFAKKYKQDINGFVNFLCESTFSVNQEYKYSWEYMEIGTNSLERYTNLCLCIREERM
jgi:hypothetical protein